MLPHEVIHQIMAGINKPADNMALNSIIGEGFAVYMNKKFWRDKYTEADNLGYSEQELKNCYRQIDTIKAFFRKNYRSSESEVHHVFRSRSATISAGLPGAIGYFIGYCIVKKYVSRHGKNS